MPTFKVGTGLCTAGTVSFFILLTESAGDVTEVPGAGLLTGDGVVCANVIVAPPKISAVVVSSSFSLAFIIGGDVCKFISK